MRSDGPGIGVVHDLKDRQTDTPKAFHCFN